VQSNHNLFALFFFERVDHFVVFAALLMRYRALLIEYRALLIEYRALKVGEQT